MENQTVIMPQNQEQPPIQPAPQPQSDDLFSWQASEYIHHHKPMSWYLGFIILGVITSALLFLILHDWFAVAVVVLMFVALFIYAIRKPDTLDYHITEDGLTIGSKHYTFDKFRSFAVLVGGGVPSISFEPLQRFSPPIAIYCAPDQVQKISELLSTYLPQSDKQPDVIDRLSQYLRF